MVNGYSLDPHPKANYATEEFAVVRMPKSNRGRVPSNSVEVVADLETALNIAKADKNRVAAIVVGPARSSEGVELYYIKKTYAS
ncbi:hypothetical protein MNB_SUP05-5-795 [hydrothermal vent metagenome]|uniref:Uncharacterized protein n=1 Tax=hydrothermal vent metagenome TaxID=652676 RepID=A0A1W1BFX9_9ZZZZ